MELKDDEFYLSLAEEEALRGTCKRRKIGALILSESGSYVLGHNGRPECLGNCLESPCPDADKPAGSGDAKHCYGIHAEISALQRRNALLDIVAVYSNKAPCTSCTIQLLNTSCRRIVFRTQSKETTNMELWRSAGREWIHLASKEVRGVNGNPAVPK